MAPSNTLTLNMTKTADPVSGSRDLPSSRPDSGDRRDPEYPMPTRRDENWRFARLDHLATLETYTPAIGLPIDVQVDLAAAASADLSSPDSPGHTFVNGDLAQARDLSQLPDGVLCMPLTEAMSRCPDLIARHFMASSFPLGSQRFAAIHKAHTRSGCVIVVPDNVEVSIPIEIVHTVTGHNVSLFPHTLLIAGKHSKVTVIDRYHSMPGSSTWVCAVVDLVADSGAKVRYVADQALSPASTMFHLSTASAKRDSELRSLILNAGADRVRNEQVSRVDGAGATSVMLGLNFAGRQQEIDQRTLQHHTGPEGMSDLLYKNVLFGEARGIFAGLIRVDKGAHHTDAFQSCRNLLMSEQAEANSMPGLEINADQVKCSHGSTSGPIADDEIFYLLSRGIPPEDARRLIAIGFGIEVLERLGDSTLTNLLSSRLDAALDACLSPPKSS
jgi:Fe-S cluster assembly protein SufD